MSVTNNQIRALRDEAGQVGDAEMAKICDKALGELDSESVMLRTVGAPLSEMEQRIEAMGIDSARAECERVIADAAAMGN